MAREWLVSGLFAATLFLSSFLLFLVQPMQGKLLLPLLGGTPAVWNTCMVFFQAVLLAGYIYAHGLASRLALRTQLIVHLAVLCLPFAFLPPLLPETLTQSRLLISSPALWLSLALALSTGPVFFAVSTTSPLLQSWFSRTGLKASANPYVLYAAGNVGSLLALIGYPILIEPRWRLQEQLRLWSFGYGALVLLILATTLVMRRTASPAVASTIRRSWRIPWRQSLRWIALALLPSSLMMGVTTFITTDLASVPLFWLVPLALYVLSFVITFGKYTERMQSWIVRLLPFCIAATIFLISSGLRGQVGMLLAIHLLTFLLAALACHGRLALDRPDPAQLTQFYFLLSLGGVLGGTFNALLAPLLFTRVAEYPLALAATLLIISAPSPIGSRRTELLGFATFALATFGLGQLQSLGVLPAIARAVSAGDGVRHSILAVLLFGLPILGALPLLRQGRLFSTALLGVTVAALFVSLGTGTILLRERSFFGVVTIYGYDDPPTHLMMHGGILHGEQRFGSEDERRKARAYFHADGPLGQILAATERLAERPQLAIIGMGAGTIAAYGSEKSAITFFELDPNVERVARDPRYFTYVDDCLKRGCELSVRIGDGRLRLKEEPRTFDLVVIDAFSSDSIPLHLLTSEAIDVYRSKLNPRGLIAFHISNQYVNLRPVLHNLSQAKGLAYASRKDEGDPAMERRSSDWVVLAPTAGDLGPILVDERWFREGVANDLGVWADDYAQIANAITW